MAIQQELSERLSELEIRHERLERQLQRTRTWLGLMAVTGVIGAAYIWSVLFGYWVGFKPLVLTVNKITAEELFIRGKGGEIRVKADPLPYLMFFDNDDRLRPNVSLEGGSTPELKLLTEAIRGSGVTIGVQDGVSSIEINTGESFLGPEGPGSPKVRLEADRYEGRLSIVGSGMRNFAPLVSLTAGCCESSLALTDRHGEPDDVDQVRLSVHYEKGARIAAFHGGYPEDDLRWRLLRDYKRYVELSTEAMRFGSWGRKDIILRGDSIDIRDFDKSLCEVIFLWPPAVLLNYPYSECRWP